jgi:hypothetical protein
MLLVVTGLTFDWFIAQGLLLVRISLTCFSSMSSSVDACKHCSQASCYWGVLEGGLNTQPFASGALGLWILCAPESDLLDHLIQAVLKPKGPFLQHDQAQNPKLVAPFTSYLLLYDTQGPLQRYLTATLTARVCAAAVISECVVVVAPDR